MHTRSSIDLMISEYWLKIIINFFQFVCLFVCSLTELFFVYLVPLLALKIIINDDDVQMIIAVNIDTKLVWKLWVPHIYIYICMCLWNRQRQTWRSNDLFLIMIIIKNGRWIFFSLKNPWINEQTFDELSIFFLWNENMKIRTKKNIEFINRLFWIIDQSFFFIFRGGAGATVKDD